jgi:hypothetical protein
VFGHGHWEVLHCANLIPMLLNRNCCVMTQTQASTGTTTNETNFHRWPPNVSASPRLLNPNELSITHPVLPIIPCRIKQLRYVHIVVSSYFSVPLLRKFAEASKIFLLESTWSVALQLHDAHRFPCPCESPCFDHETGIPTVASLLRQARPNLTLRKYLSIRLL